MPLIKSGLHRLFPAGWSLRCSSTPAGAEQSNPPLLVLKPSPQLDWANEHHSFAGKEGVGTAQLSTFFFFAFLFAKNSHDAPSRWWLCTLMTRADSNNSQRLHSDIIPDPALINPVVPLFWRLNIFYVMKRSKARSRHLNVSAGRLISSNPPSIAFITLQRSVLFSPSFRSFPLMLKVRKWFVRDNNWLQFGLQKLLGPIWNTSGCKI